LQERPQRRRNLIPVAPHREHHPGFRVGEDSQP
jgi:hypothetical protein